MVAQIEVLLKREDSVLKFVNEFLLVYNIMLLTENSLGSLRVEPVAKGIKNQLLLKSPAEPKVRREVR